MSSKQHAGMTTDGNGQQVEQGRPHEPTPGEKKHEAQQGGADIDMNPGEPARPYVGGDEPEPAGTKKKDR